MRSNIRISMLIITCIMQNTWCGAQILTLEKVLSIVDEQNPMLQQYDSKVKALDAYAAGARGWMAPMVGIGTFMTPYPGQRLMEERDKGSVMFSVEQQIPNAARLNANKNYLAAKAGIEKESRAYSSNDLRADAKMQYYQWVVAEAKLKVLRENLTTLELMLKLAQIRYPYNQGTLGNIYKTEGRLAEIQNMITMAEGDIDEKSYRLKALMNVSVESDIRIDTSAVINFVEATDRYDTASLSTRRSDVRRIDESINVMQLNQQVQRYQARPDFKIRFDHMQPLGNMPAQFTAMAMVSIPIAPWSSRMYKSEIKGMQYEIDAMRKERQAVLTETQGMLRSMQTKIISMQVQLGNYQKKIVPALRRNYQTVMVAYEENREQLPMVLDGWEALNMAQQEYLNKLNEYYIMIINYEKEIEK